MGRLRSIFSLSNLYLLEATLIGVFFIQALRFLIGSLYSRIGSATLYPAIDPVLLDPSIPGLIDPATVTNEVLLLVYVLFLPLLALLFGRFGVFMLIAAAITALGRYVMVAESTISAMSGAAIVIGGGLFYIALLIHQRARILPGMFVLAMAIDQLYRAAGDTLDPSITAGYASTQLILSVGVVVLSLIALLIGQRMHRKAEKTADLSADSALMTVWGGLGFGGLLFLQLSLLSLPNAVSGRADASYTLSVPLVMVATVLPLVPAVRGQARRFIGLFDSSVRGWSWMLILALLLVFGTRFRDLPAAIALGLAQFAASMVWWWMARPRAQKERNLAGVWLILGMVVFALLVTGDVFTYEYAFVRDFAPQFDYLNPIIPPLLRGFRGLGLALILLSAFLAVLPMVQTRRRIAWAGGSILSSVVMLLVMAGFGTYATFLARPPVVNEVIEPQNIRVGTYNIHAGYNEFFHYDLEAIAQAIEVSGPNIVLLQEVEAGRMTSFGVDQPLWLARRLGMDRRFFPTNEGLQGLAVLSNIEIVFDDGFLLDSISTQTGLQIVQVSPDAGVITIYNTWLDPLLQSGGEFSTEQLEAGQEAQLSQVFGLITTRFPEGIGRAVIGGTFNNVPDSDLVARMRDSGFIDHFAEMPLENSATYWRTGARARLDYLWTTRNLQVIGRGVNPSNASDHRLATLEIQLRQATALP